MKAAVLLAAPVAVAAQWWGGAPDCAQSCFSSAWTSATSSNAWPAPTAFCAADKGAAVSSCVDSACAATPTAYSSYSSLSSSLCSRWASCSSAGSTGVYTASQPGFAGAVGASRTWTGGVYTVTGCEWDGSPWTGGPGGWGPGGVAGGSPWAPWGHGWVWSTYTKTVVSTWTVSSANAAQVTTSANRLVTVAEAVSGSSTTTSTLYQAAATHTAGAAPAGVDLGVRVAGALLGGVVAVAGLL